MNKSRRSVRYGWLVWVSLMVALTLCPSPASASEFTHPKTFKGSDPKGWGPFYWQMTQAKAAEKGAKPFVDAEGEPRFGLPAVQLLKGRTFEVRLEFFSHMGLNAVRVTLAPHTECARDVYETLLNDLRETHGKEMESRILDYPNSHYRSHDWIVGTTKIVLHHGCPEPGKVTATQPTTHLWYEKRLEYEPWNREEGSLCRLKAYSLGPIVNYNELIINSTLVLLAILYFCIGPLFY